MNRWTALFALLAAAAAPLGAQEPGPPPAVAGATLTLGEAIAQARANSPAYRQTLNNAGPARWAVRNATSNLFLPTASATAGFGYTGAGSSQFGGTEFRQSSPSYNSNYSVGLNWRLDGNTLTGPAQTRAQQRATEEEIVSAEQLLRADVTTQYLVALQAAAQVDVSRQQVLRNEDFLKLAQARYQVGQATLLDVRRAEVEKGVADVALLRAQQTENEAKLELLRRMGVESPVAIEQLALTDSFPVVAPEFQLDQLLALADEQNPALRSLRAQETAAGAVLTAAKADYLPSFNISAGWSGFAQEFTDEDLILSQTLSGAQGAYASCLEDNQIRASAGLPTNDCLLTAGLQDPNTLRPDVVSGFRESNNVFPFNYRRSPFSANLTISLPIFTGFGRTLRVAQARAQREDADEAVRARRLAVRADVHGRYLALQTAYRSIAVQSANREAAREGLRLAQDRYRLGSGTALELSDAQNALQAAEGDYVNSVYGYHIAIAALEAAVGRPLR
ncbi:MAG TPA: TolC family protein [Gemmatimonadales bacterium]|nr:TolC family protein [Gemmatimonadales bacterium]